MPLIMRHQTRSTLVWQWLNVGILSACLTPAACQKSEPSTPRLDRKELPGFSLVLPAGEDPKEIGLPNTGMYTVRYSPGSHNGIAKLMLGKLQRLFRGYSTVKVTWRAGELSPQDLSTIRTMTAQMIGERRKSFDYGDRWLDVVSKRDGGASWLDLSLGSNHDIVFAGVYCSEGFKIDITVGDPFDTATAIATANKIVHSVQCKTHPENLVAFAPVLALSDSYGLTRKGQTAVYCSNAGHIVRVSPAHGDMVRKEGFLEDMFKKAYASLIWKVPTDEVQLTRSDELRGDKEPHAFLHLTANAGAVHNEVFAAAVYCEEVDSTFLVEMSSTGLGLDAEASRLSASLHCPDGRERPVRSAADVLGESCDRGNATACGLLRHLALAGVLPAKVLPAPKLSKSTSWDRPRPAHIKESLSKP